MLRFYLDCETLSGKIYNNFNTSNVTVLSRAAFGDGEIEQFQYIQCYGSIYVHNSNYYYVQGFQYIQCYGSINYTYWDDDTPFWFQYIQCYGSIKLIMDM